MTKQSPKFTRSLRFTRDDPKMSEVSRLRWLCRRGMKELDVVMNGYLEKHYESANANDQQHFKTLLELPDPDLYALLLGRDVAPDPELERFTRALRNLAQPK